MVLALLLPLAKRDECGVPGGCFVLAYVRIRQFSLTEAPPKCQHLTRVNGEWVVFLVVIQPSEAPADSLKLVGVSLEMGDLVFLRPSTLFELFPLFALLGTRPRCFSAHGGALLGVGDAFANLFFFVLEALGVRVYHPSVSSHRCVCPQEVSYPTSTRTLHET